MSLNDAQMAFLRTHLGFDDAGFIAKRRMSKQLEKFWRRREKVEAELKVLPPDHPDLAALTQKVQAATNKAIANDLKGAYHDLKQVKIDARSHANTEKSGINVGKITAIVNPLKVEARNLVTFKQTLEAQAQTQRDALLVRAKALPQVKDAVSRDEAFAFSRDIAKLIGTLNADWDIMSTATSAQLDTWEGMMGASADFDAKLKVATHYLMLYKTETGSAVGGSVEGDLVWIEQVVKQDDLNSNGAYLRADVAKAERADRLKLDAAIDAAKAMPDMGSEEAFFTDSQGKPLDAQASDEAKLALQDRFGRLEQQERDRLALAQEAYLNAKRNDDILNLTTHKSPGQQVALGTFDTDEFIDDVIGDADVAGLDPAAFAQRIAGPFATEVQTLVRLGPDSDELFDLAAKGPEGWKRDVAQSLGLSTDLKSLNDHEKALVEQGAAALRDAFLANYPNTSTFRDVAQGEHGYGAVTVIPDQVTVGGVVYDDVTYLTKGGGGAIFRCTCTGTGEQIVLKSPNDYVTGMYDPDDPFRDPDLEDDWDTMSEEAKMHRMAAGGADSPCHDNILDIKGVIMTPEGYPMIAMDLATAGDTDTHIGAMKGAEASGLLSPSALAALEKDSIRQTVRGVRAMQERNMGHHDMKEANVFMMADGTYKVADFGLSRANDSRSDTYQLTDGSGGYRAPELQQMGLASEKSDNFTLGVMLDNLLAPDRGKYSDNRGVYQTTNLVRQQSRGDDGEVIMESAFDRLRNSLLDPDPSKRPTLEAVLFSSYLLDTSVNYTEDDLTELRVATAAYTAAVGREVGALNTKVETLGGQIANLELALNSKETEALMAFHEARKAERELELQKAQTDIGTFDVDSLLHEFATNVIDRNPSLISEDADQIAKLRPLLDAPKTGPEKEAIQADIDAKRKEIRDAVAAIEAINARPAVAPLAARVAAASKPFEARG